MKSTDISIVGQIPSTTSKEYKELPKNQDKMEYNSREFTSEGQSINQDNDITIDSKNTVSFNPANFDLRNFEEMNQLDLSLIPESMKNRLINLEVSLKDDNLLRGKRRMLQNRRNKLK